MRHRIATPLLGLLAAVTALSGVVAAPASADYTITERADIASNWLVGQAYNGHLDTYGQADWGVTGDSILGLVAAGATPQQIAPLATALEAQMGTNYGIYVWEGVTYVDAPVLAKLLLIASVTGSDPANYNGVDLRAKVLSQVAADGHLGTESIANVFGQAYAVLGLARTGTLPASTVSYLSAQQCPGGYFRLNQSATACTNDPQDRDATAMAIMALRAAKAKGIAAASAPLDSAVAWLVADQRPSGAWIGSPFTTEENANSTGLAAAALSGLTNPGAPEAVTRALAWARSVQITRGPDFGGVAYSAASFAEATGGAIDTMDDYQWIRSTSQGMLALWPRDYFRMPAVTKGTVDLYGNSGEYTVNGRKWRTACESYGQTWRCRTEIWATTTAQVNGKFVPTTGWKFNSLTYLPYLTQEQWGANHLTTPGEHVVAGRRWKTECNNPLTGGNNCRSYIWASYVASAALPGGGYRYYWTSGWVINNMVRLKPLFG